MSFAPARADLLFRGPDPGTLRVDLTPYVHDYFETVRMPGDARQSDGYYWRGLLVQSLEFNILETAFRMSDSNMRKLIANKPFWHDYTASMKQFNMGRWNDGDAFLVNYVGHSMQGAVASYIEIQNSPTQARIRWGEPGYASSRFKAFLWSTVFSTHSEISPIGEAGIGNEGGYTYGVKCQMHCNETNFKPGDHYTNNTGWVDFIVTPTAGTLWVMAEDFLDKRVSDYFSERAPGRLYPRIIRGSLNPSRTFANALRGRVPWYRDWQESGSSLVPMRNQWGRFENDVSEEVWWPRVEIAPHFAALSTTVTRAGCTYCKGTPTGGAVEVSYRLAGPLYADVDVSHSPGASPLASDRAGGNMTTAFFGIRSGMRTPNYAVNVSLRPGFVRFSDALQSSPNDDAPAPTRGAITHFAWNFMLSADYKLTRNIALRAGIQETLVRYREACLDGSGIGLPERLNWLNHGTGCSQDPGIGKVPYFTWLSHEDFLNRGGLGYQIGPVFRF